MINWKYCSLLQVAGIMILTGLLPLHAQTGVAEPEPSDFQVPADREVVIEIPEGNQLDSVGVSGSETISVDFPDEEVRVIIRSVAELYDLNVVIPEQLVGSVSIKLRNVTWRQVFDVVLEPLGYTWIEEQNIVRIKSQEDLVQEPVDTRVFIINFARADDLQSSITPMIDDSIGGRIQVDTRSNALVIRERPTRMNAIQEIIERLDRPTDQVMIESKFVEITTTDVKNLGVNWAALRGFEVGAGPITREWARTSGRSSENEIDNVDVDTATVHVSPNGSVQPLLLPSTTLTTSSNVLGSLVEGRTDNAIFSASAFNVILSALKTDTDVEVVSNPTIVTMNNSPASINIGEDYPVPQFTYNEQQGVFEVSGFEFKPIGILLEVTPQVNAAGFISLKIAPEISLRTDTVSFGGAGAQIPIISTRRAESTVTIKSGFTLAIGGLIEEGRNNEQTKVPLLGSIPLMGRLFRSDAKNEEKRNLVIFITAKVLDPQGATYRDVFSWRTLHEMGIRSRDIPGYEPPETEADLFRNLQQARDDAERIQAESMLQQQLRALEEAKQRETRRAERRESQEPRQIPRRNRP